MKRPIDPLQFLGKIAIHNKSKEEFKISGANQNGIQIVSSDPSFILYEELNLYYTIQDNIENLKINNNMKTEYIPFEYTDWKFLIGKTIKQKLTRKSGSDPISIIYSVDKNGIKIEQNTYLGYKDIFNDYVFTDGSICGKINDYTLTITDIINNPVNGNIYIDANNYRIHWRNNELLHIVNNEAVPVYIDTNISKIKFKQHIGNS